MKKRFFNLSPVITALLISITLSTNFSLLAESVYSRVSSQALASIAKPTLSQKMKDRASFGEKATVSKYNMLKNTYDIFEKFGKKSNFFDNETMDIDSQKDLELFCGPRLSEKDSFFKQINFTNTIPGEVELQRLIDQPIDDISTLRRRQMAVRSLVSDSPKLARLTAIFKKAAQSEQGFYSFWEQKNPLNEKFLKKFIYFPDFLSGLNKNTLALNIKQRIFYDLLGLGSLGVASGFVLCFIGLGALGTITKCPAKLVLRPYGLNRVNKMSQYAISAFLITYGLILALLLVITSIPIIRDFKTRASALNHLQERLMTFANFVRAMKEASEIVNSDPYLSTVLPTHNITKLSEGFDKIRTFMKLITSRTFKGKPSYLSNTGKILKTYKMIDDVKNYFVKAMQEFGQIDAYCSVASMFKAFKDSPLAYCFPNYIKSNESTLEIEDFWFPALLNTKNITPDKVVKNSVNMNNNLNNILLTGPNQGGKSVILKSIVTSAILAQSIGIAPCKSMRFTPFSKIMTFLNVTDNTSQGISLFKAYLIRGKQVIEEAEGLPSNKHGLFIQDEPFNGTEPRETIKGAAYMGGIFAKKKNCLSIMSTHFNILSELEKETNGAYKNYKVFIKRDYNGKRIYTYTWIPGINSDHIGGELMREDGLNDPYGLEMVDRFAKKVSNEKYMAQDDDTNDTDYLDNIDYAHEVID